MFGFDFSHWNSDSDFSLYSKECDFAIHKASEGKSYKDPKYHARMVNFPKDKLWGLFHVVCPKRYSYEAELKNFCDCIDQTFFYRQCCIAIDLENTPGYVPYSSDADVKKWIVNFISDLYKKYNKRILVYMGDLYPDDWYKDFKAAGGEIWICRYRQKAPDHSCVLWQYTDAYEGHKLDADKVIDEAVFRSLWGSSYLSNLMNCCKDKVFISTDGIYTAVDEDLANACSIFADYVIKGYFGTGLERKEQIYKMIQNEVNRRFT